MLGLTVVLFVAKRRTKDISEISNVENKSERRIPPADRIGGSTLRPVEHVVKLYQSPELLAIEGGQGRLGRSPFRFRISNINSADLLPTSRGVPFIVAQCCSKDRLRGRGRLRRRQWQRGEGGVSELQPLKTAASIRKEIGLTSKTCWNGKEGLGKGVSLVHQSGHGGSRD